MRDVHRELTHWLEAAGAGVRIDAVGNLRATYAAAVNATAVNTTDEAQEARLVIGSHLDTVPNAGAYDGTLGVLLGLALLESLDGRRLPYAIEIAGFSEEEGVRFGVPFIGSRALVGRIDSELLNVRDAAGMTVAKAIEDFGLQLEAIGEARVSSEAAGYLEFHIEQGPVLESLALPLAVVDGIAGQTRLLLTFAGHANHAGTTPMNLRFDAMAGAAEWITQVERAAKSTAGMVATVGSVETKPGAGNVIAGEARLTLDVRHENNETRTKAVESLIAAAEEIARRRGLSVRWTAWLNQAAVAMDAAMVGYAEQALRAAGCEPHRMTSGAGHDAMIMAEKVPSTMIFLRTPGGISHDPEESVAVEDVAKAIECGVHLLEILASAPTFQTRTCRV